MSANPKVRRVAARALARQVLDSPDAAAGLRALIADPDEKVRFTAQRAMCYLAELETK